MNQKTHSSLKKNLILEKNTLDNLQKEKHKQTHCPKSEEMKDILEFLRIKELALKTQAPNNKAKIKKLKKLIESGQYSIDIDELSEKITKELI